MTTETLPATTPLEPTTPIKPSEAIRLGCLIAPVQAFGFWVRGDAACALMTLHLGGYDWRDNRPGGFSTYHCPVMDCERRKQRQGVTNLLPHLNDDHRWSRERIADWFAEQGL